MEENTSSINQPNVSTPPPVPQPTQAPLNPTPQPSTPMTLKTKVSWEKLLPLFLAMFAIITGITVFAILQKFFIKSPEQPPITIIISPTPSPTPVRIVTELSKTTAYQEFSDGIGSYSAKLKTFEKEDPSTNPPSLVLPLGFSK